MGSKAKQQTNRMGKKILIVDDEPKLRAMLRMILENRLMRLWNRPTATKPLPRQPAAPRI